MINILKFLLVFIVGMLVGLFYFGSLWVIVRRIPMMKRPALLVIGSFFIRNAVTVLVFYFIMGGRWERLIVSMLGFILSRIIILRRVKLKLWI